MKPKNLFDAVGDNTHSVTEKGRDALYQAGDLLGELGDYLAPKAHDLGERIGPRARGLADDLNVRARGLADDLNEFVAPRASELRKKSARLAADTRVTLQPRFDDAWDRVHPYVDDARGRLAPLVDSGRDRIEKDLLPRLNSALREVTDNPRSKEAAKRLAAARAALAGELELPEPAKKKGVVGTVVQALLAGGLLAAVAFAIKSFLAPADSGWQAHEPSAGYRVDPSTFADDLETDAPGDTVADAPGDALDDTQVAQSDDISDLDGSIEGDADPFVVSPYGEGSYVGNEPPEGYVIKGNERSMKYHVQGRDGYERTIADVWFTTEEAAQAAGFTKAQR